MVIVINSLISGLTERTKYGWLLQLSSYRCPITVNCPITTLQND